MAHFGCGICSRAAGSRAILFDTRPAIIIRANLHALYTMKLTSPAFSEAQQIGHFYEELPAVVHETVWRCEQAIYPRKQAAVQVLQVAVVSDIDGGAGMHKIGDEEVGIEVLGR